MLVTSCSSRQAARCFECNGLDRLAKSDPTSFCRRPPTRWKTPRANLVLSNGNGLFTRVSKAALRQDSLIAWVSYLSILYYKSFVSLFAECGMDQKKTPQPKVQLFFVHRPYNNYIYNQKLEALTTFKKLQALYYKRLVSNTCRIAIYYVNIIHR